MKYLKLFLLSALFYLFLPPLAAQNLIGNQLIQPSLQQLNEQRKTFGLDENASFIPQSLVRDSLGQKHIRFQQFYRGIRVWGGEVISHTDASGQELPQTAALKRDIQIEVEPTLTPAEALTVVKADLSKSVRLTREPVIELVIYPNTVRKVMPQRANIAQGKLNAEDFVSEVKNYLLAYYIHTEQERRGDTRYTDYLIDAHSGAIIEKWDSLHTSNAIGSGKSQYSGIVTLNTNSLASGYELRDMTRPLQTGNAVYDLNHGTSGTGNLYKDSDNVWGNGANFKEEPESTTSDNGQTAAVDAAYGIQGTWDMYKNVLGRNGINGLGGPVYARVHYDSAYDNAFYSDYCQCITYGDGTKLQTLTSLDVAAHEFSHGVCSTTAGLIYNKESGGLNEANSDIMGAMTEFYIRGAKGQGNTIPDTGGTWTQGEQITTPAFPLKMRFLYKPSKDGKSADAWSPNLASLNVHYSSGPMNRGFYFLSQGAAKNGETSSSFLPQGMAGIGNDKAAKIWYRALTTYMTSTTDYAAARVAMIQAVRDLFPLAGPEEIAVWNAFAAINVGAAWSGPDTPPSVTVNVNGTKGLINFNATANDDKGIVKVEFLLDGGLIGESLTAPYSIAYDSQLQDDGAHTLAAKAIDTSGAYTATTTPFIIANGQLLRNGSFEKGYGVGWSNSSGMQIGAILGQTAYDGSKMAKFCGSGSKMSVGLYQSVVIPASATSANLSFALLIETKETNTDSARDIFTVQIRNSSGVILKTLATYSNLNAAPGYKLYNFDLSDYKGQTIQPYFLGSEDAAIATGFILDKVALIAPVGVQATAKPLP